MALDTTARLVGKCLPLVVLFVAACSTLSSTPEFETTLQCRDCQDLRVLRIIDGDTLDTPSGLVRLFGVDAPERGASCYYRATGALRRLAGNTVRVEAGPRVRDRGGRLLYYVYTDLGNSVDEILVREGLAVAWIKDGQYRDTLVHMEAKARRDGAGCLW